MQLTIEIRPSAIDKVLYLLESLKKDVWIVDDKPDIAAIDSSDPSYTQLISASMDRQNNPKNYGTMEDVDWS